MIGVTIVALVVLMTEAIVSLATIEKNEDFRWYFVIRKRLPSILVIIFNENRTG